MTLIRVRGINRVTAKGRLYYYHRASGKRIQADPNDAAAFAAEVAALNANKPIDDPKTQPGTLGGLIAAYRSASAFTPTTPGLSARLMLPSKSQPVASGKPLLSPTTLACARRTSSSYASPRAHGA
jgi:hypothetical protein